MVLSSRVTHVSDAFDVTDFSGCVFLSNNKGMPTPPGIREFCANRNLSSRSWHLTRKTFYPAFLLRSIE